MTLLNKNAGPPPWTIFASTFDAANRARLLAALESAGEKDSAEAIKIRLGKKRFVTRIEPLQVRNGKAIVALQRNLEEELAPFRALEGALLVVGLVGLLLSVLPVAAIAGSLSKPVCDWLKMRSASKPAITLSNRAQNSIGTTSSASSPVLSST